VDLSKALVYVTIIGQVPHLLGISGASGNFFTKLWHVLQHLAEVSAVPALTGILCLSAMLLLRHSAPSVPAALIVMSAARILIGLLGGEASGVHVAGHIPSGLPSLTWPNLDTAILRELVPGALAIVLVGYAEALGAAKAAAMQDGNDIDPNQELVAHGPANILTGLFGDFLLWAACRRPRWPWLPAHTARSPTLSRSFLRFTLLQKSWSIP
jgi:MFS superfamily sulfate permease-like transporter